MNRWTVVLVGWVVFLCTSAAAEVLQVNVEVPSPELFQDERGYTHVEIPGYVNLASPGSPALPGRAVNVLLPPGHQMVSVQVYPSEEVELPGIHTVFPAQKPWPLCFQGPAPFTEPDPDAYAGGPSLDLSSVPAGQRLRGFSIQTVLIKPVVYRPVEGELSYHPAVTVLVTTGATKTLKPGYRGFPRDFERVRTLVDNPEMLDQYTVRTHTTRNPEYRYVVITSQALSQCSGTNNLQTLTSDKQARGISTRIMTMEDIQSGYTGVDDAEKVRNFIRDMHQNHATDFVLLAGDADLSVVGGETEPPVVPVRGLWGDIDYGEESIPSDLYYACLDGDFNADGDSKYGEENDDPDLLAEVWVGRAAVDNCTEVSNFVRKTLLYQNGGGEWLRNVWMVGEILFEYPDYFAKDDLQHVQNSSSEGGVNTKGFSESTFYTVHTMYDADLGKEGWGPSDILNVLNGGGTGGEAHLINHLGHSYTYYNMRMMTDEIISGLNNTWPFFEYTQGCYPGSFDNRSDPQDGNQVYSQDCFAEHMTLDQHGAFAAVMNTRYGLGGYSNYFHRYFWDAAFGQGESRMGVMHNYSREQMSGWVSDVGMRWVYYEITLFGDPELSFHLAASTTDPVIGLPAAEPYFMAMEGGDNPPDQTITIQNHGGKTLNWSVTSDQPWLTVSPLEGTAPTEITLSVDATGKTVGNYAANLIFEAPEATNSPQVFPVHLVVITVPSAVAPYNPASPSIDGVISAGEYAGASVLEMDLENSGASTARIMHDGSHFYFALEIGADADVDVNDAIMLMLDVNNDDLWPISPGGDGIYEIFPQGGIYSPAYNAGDGMVYGDDLWDWSPAGIASAFNNSASPRVLEVSFDLSQSHLQVAQGESFGMFLFYYDYLSGEDFEVLANWPWAIDSYDTCTYFGDVTVGTTTDNLIAIPKSLAFSGYLDGEPTEEKNLTVGGTTTNNLSFDLEVSDSWIQVSAASGTTPQIIKVQADPAGLTTGTKTGWVEITAAGANNSPYTVPVTFDVVPPPPIFSLDPEFLSFEANQAGSLPAGQSIQITNAGGGALQWTAVTEGTWFDLDVNTGTAPSTVTITPNTTDLSPGFNAGAIQLTAPGAEPARVELSYTIHIPPTLVVDPASIERTDALAGGPVEVVLLVMNQQLGPMEWSIYENSQFITIEPQSGTAIAGHPSRVTVALDPAGLGEGLHQAELTVEAPEAANSPATVAVDWTLADLPVIAVEPESLTFVSWIDGPTPAAQILSITNPGPGALNWTAQCAGANLTCTPESGTAPGQVSVSVDTFGLGVGVYDTEINIESPEGANSPVTVDVTLEITAEPQNRPPPVPSQIKPEDGAEVEGRKPSLVIGNVEDPDGDAVTYDFEIYIMGETDPLATITDVAEGDTTTTVQLGGLKIDEFYEWRARAVDDRGLAGDWSEKWIFVVVEPGGCGCGTGGEGGFGLFFLLVFYGWMSRSRLRRQ